MTPEIIEQIRQANIMLEVREAGLIASGASEDERADFARVIRFMHLVVSMPFPRREHTNANVADLLAVARELQRLYAVETEYQRDRPYAAVARSEGWRPCEECGDLELPQARCYCRSVAEDADDLPSTA